MKIPRSFLFLALLASSPLAAAKTIEMDVNGLVCAFCAQGITKSMKGFPASDGVFVSLENRIVAVHLKDGQDIADAQLRTAITDAGFDVVAIRRTDASLAEIKARVGKGKPLPADKHDHGSDHGAMNHGG